MAGVYQARRAITSAIQGRTGKKDGSDRAFDAGAPAPRTGYGPTIGNRSRLTPHKPVEIDLQTAVRDHLR